MKPSGEQKQARQVVLVTAQFGDSVIKVRQLSPQAPGKARPLTRLLQIGGAGMFLAGVALAAAGQMGLASLLLLTGLGQVVYAWARLREERRSPHFVLGEGPRADLNLRSQWLPEGRFPLVHLGPEGHQLLFTAGMQGELSCGARWSTLNQLLREGQARPVPGMHQTFACDIPPGARARVRIDETTIHVHSDDPARMARAGWTRRMDWNAQLFNSVSLSAHGLVLLMVLAVPPDPNMLNGDLFNVDGRKVRWVAKPHEAQQQEVPAWLRRPVQEQGLRGQGHKLESGKMGKKDAPRKPRVYQLKGPRNNPDPHLARQLARDQALKSGMLGVLSAKRGGAIASIFAEHETALGQDTLTALGGLIGDTTGESLGVGGLGLSGTGRGGGHTGVGVGMGPLGTIGKGGLGQAGIRYGAGVKLPDRKHRAGAPVKPEKPEVLRGSLDKSLIRRVIRRHLNQIRFCYQRELQASEGLSGRVVVRFTIAPSGQVVASVVGASTLHHSGVESCVTQAVRRWLFPKPRDGGIVQVSYPFVFRAVGTR